jgi:GNAT superfamily N-acetyltransferase
METAHNIEIRLVDAWDRNEIVELYRAGGWWKEEYNPSGIPLLIKGSFLFAVAVHDGKAVAMGRVISDGVSDGYIQDLVVLPAFRGYGIGKMIVAVLLAECNKRGLLWVGLIAEPGAEQFYLPLGFRRLEGYIPLVHEGVK